MAEAQDKFVAVSSEKPAEPQSDLPTPEQVRARRKSIWRDALLGVCVAVALILGKEWLDQHTQIGEELQLATFSWFQHRLASKEGDAQLPVAVVDLSSIKVEPIKGARRGEAATPRGQLKDLLRDLLVEHRARAVGIDVDFSPENEGRVPVTPKDHDFFDFCLRLRTETGKKIYLGAARTVLLKRESWLGPEKYKDLAANILAPRAEVTKMMKCVEVNGSETCEGDSMAALLAKELKDVVEPQPSHFAEKLCWLFEQVSTQRLSGDVAVGLFPLDYSQLTTLISREHTIDARAIATSGDFFKNNIALLGDADPDQSADKFNVPGVHEPVPGIYIHASAIYTLLRAPLYTLTEFGRWFVDLSLALFVIVGIFAIRWYYSSRTVLQVAVHRLQGLLVDVVVVLVLVVGVLLTRVHRVLWTDFTLAIFALFVHPASERYVKKLGQALVKVVPKAWRSAVLEQSKEGHEP
jgi:CHASE2 domain-containing sensor protein